MKTTLGREWLSDWGLQAWRQRNGQTMNRYLANSLAELLTIILFCLLTVSIRLVVFGSTLEAISFVYTDVLV